MMGPRFRYRRGRIVVVVVAAAAAVVGGLVPVIVLVEVVFEVRLRLRPILNRLTRRIPCGVTKVIFRNSTAEVMMLLKAVVEAR